MSATFAEAYDDVMKIITDAWKAANPSYVLVYDDLGEPQVPKTELPWARVSMRHNRGEQDTLAGPMGNRLFIRDGSVIVQVFTPLGEGLTRAYSLGKVAADAFEGKATPKGVWFRSVRLREIGPDGNWFQVNVTADFEYNEAK